MDIAFIFEFISKIIVYNTGKFILSLFGVKKEEEEEKDPLRIKTLDEVRNSSEITGRDYNFETRAKKIGFLFYFVVLILVILIL